MFETRLQKLRFLAEEMQLAFHLATHAPDAFVARTLARHILVATESFIAHARALRKPLNLAGYDTSEFHKTKETYAQEFDEYFKRARDRLGAHVQDFDFGKRIELWNEIETVKISFFVDGAIELYSKLSKLGLPDYTPYAPPSEPSDPAFNDALKQFKRSANQKQWAEIGVDSLAMTRANTSAMLNSSPIHARAGQLALIRRWINIQSGLMEKTKSYLRIERLLKTRIVTDIVSFCDCLVTRNITPGSPQEMDGLDRLIIANGQSAAPINDFVTVCNFDEELQAIRLVRDKIGAHLDDARTLISLLEELDRFDLEGAFAFYKLVEATFVKVCFSIPYLKLYSADGHRLYGVTASRSTGLPFDDTEPVPATTRPQPPSNDEEAYRQNLGRWLDGDEAQKRDARQFFWQAFSGSEVAETIDEFETFGAGTRYSGHDLRKAHVFVLSVLESGLSHADFCGVLELLLSCHSGWPYPLAEILVRYGRTASELQKNLICYALGEIGSSPHATVSAFLTELTKSPIWDLRLSASLALFKTFIKSEGLLRLNHKERPKADYNALVNSLTANMRSGELLICLLSFASILGGRDMRLLARPFADDYAALQGRLEKLCEPYLKDAPAQSNTLKLLIQTHDYVGVSVLLASSLDEDDPFGGALLTHCCNGAIVTAAHDQAARHLALCFFMKKEYDKAYDVAVGIAARHPDNVSYQILVAQILVSTPHPKEDTAKRVSDIRRFYALTAPDETLLVAVEKALNEPKRS